LRRVPASNFSASFGSNGSFVSRRYTQAAVATSSQTQPSPATQKFAERLKTLAVDKPPVWQNKKYPRVLLREETEEQRVDKLKKLLNDFQPSELSVVQLNTALEICKGIKRHPEVPALLDRAVTLLQEHKKLGTTTDLTKSIILLGVLHRLPDALSVAETAKAKSKSPHNVTAINLIRACGLGGDLKKAREFFDSAPTKTPVLIAALAEAYARNGDWNEASHLIRTMEFEHNVQPSFRVFRRYLLQCVIQGEKSKGLAMLEFMKAKHVRNGARMKWMEKVINGPAWKK